MTRRARARLTVRELVIMAALAATMFAIQLALSFLPNIELVSLLTVVYTRCLGVRALFVIYAFVLLEGLVYGFGLWFINYLYVWAILWAAAMMMRNEGQTSLWALLLAGFGLMFGALCSIPYFFIGGPNLAFSYILSGIPFDLAHCAGNAVAAIALFKPLGKLLEQLLRTRGERENE